MRSVRFDLRYGLPSFSVRFIRFIRSFLVPLTKKKHEKKEDKKQKNLICHFCKTQDYGFIYFLSLAINRFFSLAINL